MATTSWFTSAAGTKTSVATMVTAGVANQDIFEVQQPAGERSTKRLQFAKNGAPVDAATLAAAVARESATALPTTDAQGQTDRPDPAKVPGTVPVVTGSRGTATAAVLTSLLTALNAHGIIKDNTTA